MNALKSKLLFKSIVCPPVCFCPLIGCVLIPPPLGFLTTFFVQNLKFSKSFHMNPELEVIKLFWICKMTNTRRSYNCTFALLNRESIWTGRILIPPPLGLFRVNSIKQTHTLFSNIVWLDACLIIISKEPLHCNSYMTTRVLCSSKLIKNLLCRPSCFPRHPVIMTVV